MEVMGLSFVATVLLFMPKLIEEMYCEVYK